MIAECRSVLNIPRKDMRDEEEAWKEFGWDEESHSDIDFGGSNKENENLLAILNDSDEVD